MSNSNASTASVAGHYDQLDRFYRQLWGEHVHHGLWTRPSMTPEEAVRHLVHRVARDAELGRESRVCDVGCGYGAPARLWARAYGAKVTGFTVSKAQKAYADRQSTDGPPPTYRRQDFLEEKGPDEHFDAVVAIESLTHIRDPARVLRKATRILVPGGRLVACVWMRASDASPWARRHLLGPIVEEGRLAGLPTATDLHRWTTAAGLRARRLDDRTSQVRRTWTVVIARFVRALFTDSTVLKTLLDASASERVFARTLLRIWLAQHLGALRYGWLVAEKA